jgi:hypothetical protein
VGRGRTRMVAVLPLTRPRGPVRPHAQKVHAFARDCHSQLVDSRRSFRRRKENGRPLCPRQPCPVWAALWGWSRCQTSRGCTRWMMPGMRRIGRSSTPTTIRTSSSTGPAASRLPRSACPITAPSRNDSARRFPTTRWQDRRGVSQVRQRGLHAGGRPRLSGRNAMSGRLNNQPSLRAACSRASGVRLPAERGRAPAVDRPMEPRSLPA